MSYESIQIEPAGAVGAFVHGVDLTQFDDTALGELRGAFAEYSVLFFRDQNLSPEQHIALAERWGEINVNRFFAAVPDYPNIAMVLKEPGETLSS